MKHIVRVALLLGVCWTGSSSGQDAHSGRNRAVSPIRAMLLRHVDRVKWDDAPLSEVFGWLRSQSTRYGTVNVIPRWRVLAVEGIDKQTSVTLELEVVSVAVVLNEVLDLLSGPDPLTYQGAGNVLRISTRSDFRRRLYTRTYNVAEILAYARASRVAPRIAIGRQVGIATATAVPGAGVGGAVRTIDVGVSIFGNVEDEQDDDNDDGLEDAIAQQLIEMIQTTIEPGSWSIHGGRGTLYLIDGMLTVRNSADVHQLLAGVFYR